MISLNEQSISCPYCGESSAVLLDEEETGSEYIEDCQVCCRPIVFSLSMDSKGDLSVSVRDENEA
jgi:hypothetical protein